MGFARYSLKVINGPFGAGWRGAGTACALGLVAILTVVSQVGGLVLWICIGLVNGIRNIGWFARVLWILALFNIVYGVVVFFVVPPLAKLGGRVPLPCVSTAEVPIQPSSLFFCLTNRNYVVPTLAALSGEISKDVAVRYPGTIISYLDAGFPFGFHFPLLPHLSHGDGRKVDFALFYRDVSGARLDRGGAWGIGYFAFRPAEKISKENRCRDRAGFLRWDVDFLQSWFDDLTLDLERSRELASRLVEDRRVERLFVEPKLVPVLGLKSDKVGFVGCSAARHDDHFHVQIR